jgi:DNA modification methylase
MNEENILQSEDGILCGDCIEVLETLPAECARLMVADPPYFRVLTEAAWDNCWESEAEYLAWTQCWIAASMRVLMPGGLLFCFGQVGKRQHLMLHLMSQATRQWQFHDLIIWDRAVGYNDRGDSFTPAYEMALVLRKEGASPYFDKNAVREAYSAKTIARYLRDKRYKNREARLTHLKKGKKATNIWRIPSLKGNSREKVGHPSQKPIALIERIIQSCSAPDDLVIDPFGGSGTTLVAAQRLGRRALAIEISEEYCALARRRLVDADFKALRASDQKIPRR